MFDAPKNNDSNREGTSENPVAFSGDSACGWELLLGDIYSRFEDIYTMFVHLHALVYCLNMFHLVHRAPITERRYTNEQLLSLLEIANKYCMEELEVFFLYRLKQDTSTAGYVDWIVGSQMIDSKALYEEGLQGLIDSNAKLDRIQLRKIGMDAVHSILEAANVKIGEAKEAQVMLKIYEDTVCTRCRLRVLLSHRDDL